MDTWEVEQALLRLQDDFHWPVRADNFEVVDVHERSRSGASMMRVSGGGLGLDLMVKTSTDWTDEKARAGYQAMVELCDLFGSEKMPGVAALDSLGWSASPAMVVMPYLEAEELGVAIRREVPIDVTAGYLRLVGEMLAAYHEAHASTNADDRRDAASEAIEVAGLLPGGSARARRLLADMDGRVTHLFRDTTLGNIVIDPDQRLFLIDPPTVEEPGFVHEDLASLLFDMRKKLAGHTETRRPPVAGHDVLREAFLDAYFDGPRQKADDALIALFEFRAAAATAKKRVRSGSFDSIWFARRAAASAVDFFRHT